MPLLAALIREATCCNVSPDGQGFVFTPKDGQKEAFSAFVRRAQNDLSGDYLVFATPAGRGHYVAMYILPMEL